MKIQTAQFFLRNAPTLDEDYMKSMNYRKRQMMTSKEVELTRKGYRPHEFYEIPYLNLLNLLQPNLGKLSIVFTTHENHFSEKVHPQNFLKGEET